MQIESLFQMGGIAPVPAGATAPTPELAPEFGNLLELALTAPPDTPVPPDEGPPETPVISLIEEANMELPNADQTNPLDLPIEEPHCERPLTPTKKERKTGIDEAEFANLSMAYAQVALVSAPKVQTQLEPTKDDESSVLEPIAVAPPAVATDSSDDAAPVFAPSPEFPEFATVDSPSLHVTSGTVKVDSPATQLLPTEAQLEFPSPTQKVDSPAARPLLTEAQLEFLNPTQVDGSSSPLPKHPLTGEPLNPAVITISGAAETKLVPTVANPEVKQPDKPAEVKSRETVKAAKKLAFADRVDMKKAFESGFSETIERVEVPIEAVMPMADAKTAPATQAQVTEHSAPTAPKTAAEVELQGKTETFQLAGTEVKPNGLAQPTNLDEKERSPIELEAKPVPSDPVKQAESRATRIASESKLEASPDSEKLNRQIADKAQTFLAFRREGALTIHLEPRELGQITMSVKMENGNVSTEIKASNHQVAQSLETNKQDFIRQIESRGLSLGSLNISMSNQGQSGEGQQHTANHQDFARQTNMNRFFTSSTPQPSVLPAAAMVSSGRGLDYLI